MLSTTAYLALYAIFQGVPSLIAPGARLWQQAYSLLGSVGTVWVLLRASFGSWWVYLKESEISFGPDVYLTAILNVAALVILLFSLRRREEGKTFELLPMSFAIFLVIIVIGTYSPLGPLLVNLLVFAVGLTTILRGSRQNSLGIMNYGMGVISLLIICRFFDTDLSFIVRGLLFIGVGVGFFLLNYLTLKKRKANE